MAALASAWCGPMRSARKSVRGGAVAGMTEVRRRLHEDDGAPRRRPRCTRRVSARSCRCRRQRATARQLISRCTRSAIGRTSKRPVPSRRRRGARAASVTTCRRPKPSTRVELELAPQLDEAAHAEHRIGEVRGEVAGVDGADARAAEDVDPRRRAAERASDRRRRTRGRRPRRRRARRRRRGSSRRGAALRPRGVVMRLAR